MLALVEEFGDPAQPLNGSIDTLVDRRVVA